MWPNWKPHFLYLIIYLHSHAEAAVCTNPIFLPQLEGREAHVSRLKITYIYTVKEPRAHIEATRPFQQDLAPSREGQKSLSLFFSSVWWDRRGLPVCLYSPADLGRFSPEQWLWEPPRGLGKTRPAGTHPHLVLVSRSGGDLGICISNAVPGWEAVVPRPLLENELPTGPSFMPPNLSPSLGSAFLAQIGAKAEWRGQEGWAEGWGRRPNKWQHFDTGHMSHLPRCCGSAMETHLYAQGCMRASTPEGGKWASGEDESLLFSQQHSS